MGDFINLNFQLDTKLLTKRGHGKLMRDLNRQMARRHRDRIIPKHFSGTPETVPGGGGYGYERRSMKWNKRKQEQVGHTIPLVFTGRLRATIRRSSRITATQHRWRFRARGYFPLTFERRREIEVVSRRERREMAALMEKLYPLLAAQPKYQQFRRQRLR